MTVSSGDTELVDRLQSRLQTQNANAVDTATLQRHAKDLEQLLAEANQRLSETRYDNQLLVRRLLQLTMPDNVNPLATRMAQVCSIS
jgi:hypothetical protein